MMDLVVSGCSTNKDFSVRNLTGGSKHGGGNRGLLDVLMAKKKILHYMLGQWLPEKGCPLEALVKFKAVTWGCPVFFVVGVFVVISNSALSLCWF
jgi:hypothetical protein